MSYILPATMPAPDPGFEQLYLLYAEPSLEKVAPWFAEHLNKFSDVRDVRIERFGEHEGEGWALRFHAPIGENETAWRKVLG